MDTYLKQKSQKNNFVGMEKKLGMDEDEYKKIERTSLNNFLCLI